MTGYKRWCEPPKIVSVGPHVIDILVSLDDELGVGAVAEFLPKQYAEVEALAHIAQAFGKDKVSGFLRRKFPRSQSARSGDLGEVLATAYLAENCGYVVGPSRLIHRDHQEWAMRGDDVLAARCDPDSKVVLAKTEAKSRARTPASVVAAARKGLQRNEGLPSPHSLTQFAERLLATADAELGDAILEALLGRGVRPNEVTHVMFLFTGSNPSNHVQEDLAAYEGDIVQQAVILRVTAHQEFIRAAYERAIAYGA